MAAAVVVALELLVVMVDRVEEEMVVKEMLLLEVMEVPILVEVAVVAQQQEVMVEVADQVL